MDYYVINLSWGEAKDAGLEPGAYYVIMDGDKPITDHIGPFLTIAKARYDAQRNIEGRKEQATTPEG